MVLQSRRPVAIIDETVRLLRRTWRAQLPFALIVFGVGALLAPFQEYVTPFVNLLTNEFLARLPDAGVASPVTWGGGMALSMVVGALTWLINVAMGYGMIIVCRDAVNMRASGLSEVMSEIARNAGRMLGQALLIMALLWGAVVLYMLFGLSVLAGDASMGLVYFGMLLVYFAVGIALLVYIILFSIRWLLSDQVNMNEGTWFFASLTRSWRLTRHSVGRVLGYSLLLAVISGVVRSVVTMLFSALGSTFIAILGAIVVEGIAAATYMATTSLYTVLYRTCRERADGEPYPDWQ